nr:MAG TPA: hypothetical protein [Bacteriophage sp.]
MVTTPTGLTFSFISRILIDRDNILTDYTPHKYEI